MKKTSKLILSIMIVGSLLMGCGTKDPGTDLENPDSQFSQSFEAEIIEVGTSLLVAPDQNSNEYRTSDKISVSLLDAKIVDGKGEELEKDQLKAGDRINIGYSGEIAESYPAQIWATGIEVLGHNLIIDGYMALIDDIYTIDSGLNGDITMLAFDTTQWSDVTEIQKEIILTLVNKKYGLEIVQGTYDELVDAGLINKEELYFEKGILIELKNMKYDEKNKTLTASVSKWRSGLGAIGSDAKAKYDGTEWKITKTNNWIS